LILVQWKLEQYIELDCNNKLTKKKALDKGEEKGKRKEKALGAYPS